MRCRIGHSASTTGRANTPAFARKRKKTVSLAGVTPQTKKAIFQNSAFQKRPEFVFNKLGNRTISFLLQGQKRLQLSGDNLVQKRLLWTAGTVNGGRTFHGARPAIAYPCCRTGDSTVSLWHPTISRGKPDKLFQVFP